MFTVHSYLFENFSNLIHASSPRYFKNTSDEIEQYDFVGRDSSEKKTEHLIRFMETVKIKNNPPFLINQIHSDEIFILKDESQTREQVSKIKEFNELNESTKNLDKNSNEFNEKIEEIRKPYDIEIKELKTRIDELENN